MPAMPPASPTIRRLGPQDAAAFQALRLEALRDSPAAFSSSHEEEVDTPIARIEANLAPESGRNLFGAFDGEQLVGMLGAGRDTGAKSRHKASIRAMYVSPSHRGAGAGRKLLEHALDFVAAMDGIRQLTVSVTGGNESALALYKAAGFTVFGHEPRGLLVDGAFHDTIHMARLLDPS